MIGQKGAMAANPPVHIAGTYSVRPLTVRVRERVVGICTQLLREGIRVESENKKSDEEYWVRATLVEALFGLGKAAESEAEFAVAKRAALEPWMINTTEEQLAKLRALQR
jgi:hypothetical protein